MRIQPNLEAILRTLRDAAWAPLLVLGLFLAASLLFDAYTRFPRLDMPTHFFGGVAVTYLFWCGVGHARDLGAYLAKVNRTSFVFGCTAATAILWEVFEFLSDHYLATHMQHGLADTLSDVFFGLAGGAAYLLVRRLGAASAGTRDSPGPP